jgi:hypothetical protein
MSEMSRRQPVPYVTTFTRPDRASAKLSLLTRHLLTADAQGFSVKPQLSISISDQEMLLTRACVKQITPTAFKSRYFN